MWDRKKTVIEMRPLSLGECFTLLKNAMFVADLLLRKEMSMYTF